MEKRPTIHLSNNINSMIMLMRDCLLFSPSKPFTKKIVFLPHLNLKHTLMTRFVSDKRVDVVFGLEFRQLGEGMHTLIREVSDTPLTFPPPELLALHIESLIDEDNPPFAASLAYEFLKFGTFRGSPLSGWKKTLWDAVFKKWNHPYQLLEIPLRRPRIPVEVHLFNFPFLPKIYHLFFARLAPLLPIHYYQFSPCCEFWSDVITEGEKRHITKNNPHLIPYLDEGGHHLLANFGKLGRETFRIFEEEDFPLDEHYLSVKGETALSHLQHGILNFQETQHQQDSSLRLFSAPSKLREVEILHHILLEMQMPPSEIQIFAPQIADYAPLIEHIFGADNSPFDLAIYNLSKHSLIESLFLLFSLDRFEPPAIFSLFSNAHFSPLTKKEAKRFQSWIEGGSVKWGVDEKHRKSLLPNYLEEGESGTWEQAFKHLINNLLFLPKSQSPWDLPYLNFSDVTLLERCISLIRSLKDELDFLKSASLPLTQWANHLHALFHHYFLIPDKERGTYRSFMKKLQMLRKLGESNTTPYPFSSIKRYLSSLLKRREGAPLSKQLNAISCRSLQLGTILSSKIIAILGMDENAFPRHHIPSSLSLLDSTSDYCPHPAEEGRYIFLEALIAAQEGLILSYQNTHEEDGKEQSPSILIQELNLQEEIHPTFPFHHHYFSRGATYPQRYFEMAQHFYAPKNPLPFIPEFVNPTPLPTPPKGLIEVDIVNLSRFAKHPLRYYCNQTLNLYLPYRNTTDEEFQLNPLKKMHLSQKNFYEADLHGHLPLGRFKEVAYSCLEEELPPLERTTIDLTLEPFHLFGLLEVSPSPPKTLPEKIKYYPLYLLYNRDYTTLLCYLHYFHIATLTPSPLHPLLANTLLKKGPQELSKKIKTLPAADPYLQLSFKGAEPQVIFDTWQPLLHATFKELL